MSEDTSVMRETFVSQSHHYSFVWFLGFSLWPTFHFALRIASLFALGTWPLFLWPGKWLWVLVFPDFVEVHAVGGVCFLHNGASSEGPLEHRCPDASSVRCPERFSSFSSWGWALESVPLPCPLPTFGESQSSGLRVILVQECFLDFAFWHFPCIYHPYYSFWDLLIFFEGKDFRLFTPPFICSTPFILLHRYKAFQNSLIGLFEGKDCVLFIFCICFAPNTMPGPDHTVSKMAF